jgi:hypothetical protein
LSYDPRISFRDSKRTTPKYKFWSLKLRGKCHLIYKVTLQPSLKCVECNYSNSSSLIVFLTGIKHCRPIRSQVAAVYRFRATGRIFERNVHSAGLPVHRGSADRDGCDNIHRGVSYREETEFAGTETG